MQVSEPKQTFDLLSETSSALRTEKALLTVMTQPEKKVLVWRLYSVDNKDSWESVVMPCFSHSFRDKVVSRKVLLKP